MKSKSGGFFWASYTDLMISLFFVMLLLFVLSYLQLRKATIDIEVELSAIRAIQDKIDQLKGYPDYFEFDEEGLRFEVRRRAEFPDNVWKIDPKDRPYLMEVGRVLQRVTSQRPSVCIDGSADQAMKERLCTGPNYLLIIEGSASPTGNAYENKILSYRRALSLEEEWKKEGIEFQKDICDVQVAGSGTDSRTKDRSFRIQLVPIVPEVRSVKVD